MELWRCRVWRSECEDRRMQPGPSLAAAAAAGLGLYYVTGASHHAVATIETSISTLLCVPADPDNFTKKYQL